MLINLHMSGCHLLSSRIFVHQMMMRMRADTSPTWRANEKFAFEVQQRWPHLTLMPLDGGGANPLLLFGWDTRRVVILNGDSPRLGCWPFKTGEYMSWFSSQDSTLSDYYTETFQTSKWQREHLGPTVTEVGGLGPAVAFLEGKV